MLWLLGSGATLLLCSVLWCDSWVLGQLCCSIMLPPFYVWLHCSISVTLGFWGHYPTNEGEQLMCFQSWISISYLAFIPLSLLITISSICSTFTHRVLWVSIASLLFEEYRRQNFFYLSLLKLKASNLHKNVWWLWELERLLMKCLLRICVDILCPEQWK